MADYSAYRTIAVDTTSRDKVATVRLKSRVDGPEGTDKVNHDAELGAFFSELRGDDSVRVVVLTGEEDGEFSIALPRDFDRSGYTGQGRLWQTMVGNLRAIQAMVEMEKPIVCRLNGDALGLGQALMVACDLIIARDDVKITDIHLAMGETYPSDGRPPVGPTFGFAPGDGGGALLPLFLSPTKLKELLFLSPMYTAKEFEELGIINYAVPADQLDATVDDIVDRLLARSAYALAWTKRIASRHVAQQLNLAFDMSLAYEYLNFAQAPTIEDDSILS